MKYFDRNKSYEENKKIFRELCKKYHPDKSTGNEEVMKEINNEWESYTKGHTNNIPNKTDGRVNHSEIVWAFWEAMMMFQDDEEEVEEKEYITFRGRKYLIDENILETIALRYGGLGLMEFTSSKEWNDYIKK